MPVIRINLYQPKVLRRIISILIVFLQNQTAHNIWKAILLKIATIGNLQTNNHWNEWYINSNPDNKIRTKVSGQRAMEKQGDFHHNNHYCWEINNAGILRTKSCMDSFIPMLIKYHEKARWTTTDINCLLFCTAVYVRIGKQDSWFWKFSGSDCPVSYSDSLCRSAILRCNKYWITDRYSAADSTFKTCRFILFSGDNDQFHRLYLYDPAL